MIILVPSCLKDADGARTRSDQKSMIIVVPSCLKNANGARTRSDQKCSIYDNILQIYSYLFQQDPGLPGRDFKVCIYAGGFNQLHCHSKLELILSLNIICLDTQVSQTFQLKHYKKCARKLHQILKHNILTQISPTPLLPTH